MSATMTIPQVLRATADHLNERGWVQGAYYAPRAHIEPVIEAPRFTQDVAGLDEIKVKVVTQTFAEAPSCMLGALAEVSGARARVSHPLMEPGNLNQAVARGERTPEIDVYLAATRVLETVIKGRTVGKHWLVPTYNDEPGRTLEQVITMLHAAADYAEQESTYREQARQVLHESMGSTMAAMAAMGANAAATAEALKASLAALDATDQPTPEVDAVMTLQEAAAVVDAAVEAVSA